MMRPAHGRHATVLPRRRATTPGAPLGGRRRRPDGFTLVELTIVIVIIGIITAFVLAAGAQGIRRAEERATQGLISKLDLGVTDRLDALMSRSITPTGTHRYLSAINPPGATGLPWGLPSEDRARVIARLDDLKAEMPDSFTVDLSNTEYPLNFGGLPYPASATGHDAYLLPLGHMAPAYRPETWTDPSTRTGPLYTGTGDNPVSGGTAAQIAAWKAQATGIYGASWEARAAFNKLLGVAPRGYDGVDNDGNGYVDELTPGETGMSAAEISAILARLANHDPGTARAEALYAMLIEGIGPMGSVFSADDFTDQQIMDTDGDGLPEFVDAWGQPLQFYRWPVYYPSPIQKGVRDYTTAIEPRDTSPYDQNNSLVAPAWWSAQFNVPPAGSIEDPSFKAQTVMAHFYSLTTPTTPAGNAPLWSWDRSTLSPRRAYYSRPLIISSGPDLNLGLDGTREARPLPFITTVDPNPGQYGLDDISNQTLQQGGGGVQ